jgi:protein-tyrosine-phosphatase
LSTIDAAPAGRRPQSVLFACSLNAVRSPMAEALGRHMFGRSIYFASAGVGTGALDPFAIAVMDELGLDIARYRPQAFEDLDDASFDLIVTLSPEAHHRALDFTRTLGSEVVYWPTFDATAAEGTREVMLDAYRAVREHLTQRIRDAFQT